MAVPPHLKLRSGETKAAATDAVARSINDARVDAREKKTARLRELREAKQAQEMAEQLANPAPVKKKRAPAKKKIDG
ncbi:MAG: hypothetical protein H0T56_13740 [Pseudaminobacter sp.]|nr:hypothetical protein [Pseudaminobacter sp.]